MRGAGRITALRITAWRRRLARTDTLGGVPERGSAPRGSRAALARASLGGDSAQCQPREGDASATEDALGGLEGEEVLRAVAGRGSGSVLTPRKAQKWVGVGREAGQRQFTVVRSDEAVSLVGVVSAFWSS